MASCLESLDMAAAASSSYQTALAIFKKTLGSTHPDTAVCYNNLAHCLWRNGKFDTGLGKQTPGSGMLGFSQALLRKGARAVVLSGWKVDDSATALLMRRFYQNLLGKRTGLAQPLGRADALHEAKRWLRSLTKAEAMKLLARVAGGAPRGERGVVGPALKRVKAAEMPTTRPFADPYYWAAFALIGDPD